nr:leukotriene B4 receptor 1-like [Pogona vitticeps]
MSSPEETSDHPSLSVARTVVCAILGLSFAVGVPGNSFVIWTICGQMKERTPTVVLILHLSIADLLVLVTMPLWIYSFASAWTFGIVACKALAFVVYCSMYVSIFLITALSLERFLAISYPFAAQRWKKKTTTPLAVFLIWFLSIAFGATIVPFQEMVDTEGGLQCAARSYDNNSQEAACLLLETVVGFILPFAIISTCYACIGRRIGRMTCPSKRRSARLMASVVIAFGLCWFPHHVFNLLSVASLLTEDPHPEASQALGRVAEMGVYIASSVAFISSCINPLLYAFAARNVRSSARFTKFSKLFEQINPVSRQESPKETPYPNEQEKTTSMEII